MYTFVRPWVSLLVVSPVSPSLLLVVFDSLRLPSSPHPGREGSTKGRSDPGRRSLGEDFEGVQPCASGPPSVGLTFRRLLVDGPSVRGSFYRHYSSATGQGTGVVVWGGCVCVDVCVCVCVCDWIGSM